MGKKRIEIMLGNKEGEENTN